MPQDIFIVGSGLSDKQRECLENHLRALEEDIIKQSMVHFVDSLKDVPAGAEALISRKQHELEELLPRKIEIKEPEIQMLPMGNYSDGRSNRRERRRRERQAKKSKKIW